MTKHLQASLRGLFLKLTNQEAIIIKISLIRHHGPLMIIKCKIEAIILKNLADKKLTLAKIKDQ